MSLGTIVDIAKNILQRTSVQHWENIVDSTKITEESNAVWSLRHKLRDAIVAHNALLNRQYDGRKGLHDILVGLSHMTDPNMGDITHAMKSQSPPMHGCVVRNDVPDDILFAHIAAALVQREANIMSCLAVLHTPALQHANA